MNMQPDFFITLIEKYLAGKASTEEIQLLEEYYTRMGRKEAGMPDENDGDIQTEIFSALQSRIQSAGAIRQTPVLRMQRKWWMVAAMFVLLAGAAAVLLQSRGEKKETTQETAPVQKEPLPRFATIQTQKKQMLDTVLQDGTRITLNENSSVTIPVVFAANERMIELAGEAFFEVKHDVARPFIVKAGNDRIEDLGTRFNVNARNAKAVKVTLVEGLVRVNNDKLLPGQQYVNGKISRIDTAAVTAWTDSFLDDKTISFTRFPEETALKFEKFMTVENDGDKLGGMFLADDTTLMIHVVTPHRGNYFFRSYSLQTKHNTGGYIKSPSGPGIWHATFPGLHRKRTAWVYDLTTQTLLMTDINKSSATSNPVRAYNITKPYYDVQLMDNLKLVATTDMNSMLDLLEYNIGTDLQTGSYGAIAASPDNVQPTAWKGAHQSFVYLKPTENKAVIARRFTDEIRIFDLRTKHSLLVKGPENIPLEFNSIPVPGMANTWAMERTEKTKMVFHHGAVTNDFIYLLFSGEYDEMKFDPQSRKNGSGQYLFVYD